MTQFEIRTQSRFNRAFLWFLVAHLPVFLCVSFYFRTSAVLALGLGTAIVSGPWLLFLLKPSGAITTMSIGAASMCMSGLLIHLGRGMIEMHFHVFTLLAILIWLADYRAIVVATVTIAVHHLTFFFLLPSSVFNYQASLGIVLLHAVFVVFEAIPLCYIAHRFRKFIRIQGMLSEKLVVVDQSVSGHVGHLTESSRRLANDSCSQAASIEETSAALCELSSMTERSAADARQVKAIAGEARNAAESGRSDTVELDQAMEKIKGASDNIARIVKTIDEISFQTNILALNAAVEAARAGEAGLGFAVVADEVRNLAQRSASASRETADLILESTRRSQIGVELTKRVANRLQDISERTRSVDELVAKMTSSSADQSSGIAHVSSAVQEMEKVTQKNSAAAEESAAMAAELKNMSNELAGVVDSILGMVSQDKWIGKTGRNRGFDSTESDRWASECEHGSTSFSLRASQPTTEWGSETGPGKVDQRGSKESGVLN